MDIEIGVMATKDGFTYLINGKTFKTGKNGYLKINSAEIAVKFDEGPQEYDRLLSEFLSKEQMHKMYKFITKSPRFGQKALRDLLGDLDKSIADKIIKLGIQQEVFVESTTGNAKKVLDECVPYFVARIKGLKEEIEQETMGRLGVVGEEISRMDELEKFVPGNKETVVSYNEEETKPVRRTLKKAINIPKKKGK